MRKARISLWLAPAVIILFCGWFDTTSGLNQKGNKNFKDKRYETALEAYRKAQVQTPEQPETRYNLGTTLYQLDEFQEAEENLAQSIQNAKTNELKARAWYNYGNAQYRLGQFEKAIDAYRKTLELNPEDQDAKFNLELLQKKKGAFENKQKQRDKEKKDKPQQQNKNRQQQSKNKQQQNQGGGGAQQQSGQQGQGNEGQNEGQNQKEDQEKQNQGGGGERQKEQQQQDQKQGEGQPQEAKQSEGEEEKEGDQKQNEQKNSGREMTPVSISPLDQQTGAQPDQTATGPQKALLQGQMSRENAYRILDALKASEQQIQIMRRPIKPQKEREPEKDW